MKQTPPLNNPIEVASAMVLGAANDADLEAEARDVLFPRLTPTSASHVAVLTICEETFLRSTFGRELADLHRDALVVDPAFAKFLRSGPVRARVRATAGAIAPATLPAIAAAETEAVASYELAILEQLAGIEEFQLHTALLAALVPPFKARIEAALAPHQGA